MRADETTTGVNLPHFFLTTSGLPPGEAFELWRALLTPMYEVCPTTPSAPLPFGSNIAYPIDDLVAHRTLLSTQRLRRDNRRVEAGPDHYIVQLYRSGRFDGTAPRLRLGAANAGRPNGSVLRGPQRTSGSGCAKPDCLLG